MIDNKVKLVIWDLDDTFWQGTLSEGTITPVSRNVEAVKELSRRGIINSICSKNDHGNAKAKLLELDIYEYFVFPSISYNPKGEAVSEIIEGAALRSENVLFLDDNRLNLEEVKFFNPGIMACHPDDVLAVLLDHSNLAGEPDPDLTRLKQYQFLQHKAEERNTSTLSNEDFLRASNIRITVDIDVEGDFDRIVDLINRSNQLNYTKHRLETPESLKAFRESLGTFGFHAGCVRAIDNYGDYGLIGFFLIQRIALIKKLIHFVFSCRTMHMGIEQYIYEMLDRPEISIAQPVSYGLDHYDNIDWINSGNSNSGAAEGSAGRKLVLLGGCDLLQLASYCSPDRLEFVNKIQGGIKVRYDDPGFLVGDRAKIRESAIIRKIPCWTYEDAVKFDKGIAISELTLLSMWPATKGSYFHTRDDVTVHFTPDVLQQAKRAYPDWFNNDVKKISLSFEERLSLISRSFSGISRKSGDNNRIFVLGSFVHQNLDKTGQDLRTAFNEMCRKYCAAHGDIFEYIDINAIVPAENLVDRSHFNREGYFMLAKYILNSVSSRRIRADYPLGAA